MKTTILQIPINKQLRDKAKKVADKQGFSSLQEVIRVFLNQFAERNLEVGFTPSVHLSVDADNRYAEMVKEIESGQVKLKKLSSANQLMKHLKSLK